MLKKVEEIRRKSKNVEAIETFEAIRSKSKQIKASQRNAQKSHETLTTKKVTKWKIWCYSLKLDNSLWNWVEFNEIRFNLL